MKKICNNTVLLLKKREWLWLAEYWLITTLRLFSLAAFLPFLLPVWFLVAAFHLVNVGINALSSAIEWLIFSSSGLFGELSAWENNQRIRYLKKYGYRSGKPYDE